MNARDLPHNFCSLSREKKWEAYLKSSAGRKALQCILQRNPLWKDAATTASHISSIYRFASNFIHGISHDMDKNPGSSIVLDKIKTNVQTYGAMACLAQLFDIKLYNIGDM